MGSQTVFVEITLNAQADDVLDAFEQAVSKIPNVLECHLMAGSADYILKVVAEDTEDYSRIHRQHLTRLPGVAQIQVLLRSVLYLKLPHYQCNITVQIK